MSSKPIPKVHKLQQVLQKVGLRQGVFARNLNLGNGKGMSDTALSLILNHGVWPKSVSALVLVEQMRKSLKEAGANDEAIDAALGELKLPKNETKYSHLPDLASLLEDSMILRHQTLHPTAKRHFQLFRDPFAEPQCAEEVFSTGDIRYVQESMFQTAKNGGFLAVVGESGAGKSTLRRLLADRIESDKAPVVVIEPFVLASEDNDVRGKTLKSAHITEAIMRTLAPLAVRRSNRESQFAQVKKTLIDSRRAGNAHVVIIEEAHSLPLATLKHLKRFLELEDGFKRLLSVILIGQPELKAKLATHSFEVREVVQRCEVIELLPLDRDLEAYLDFKFQTAGKKLGEVMEGDALLALRDKLTIPTGRRGGNERISMLYPLAVNNVVTAAMNSAAELGVPKVSAAVFQEL